MKDFLIINLPTEILIEIISFFTISDFQVTKPFLIHSAFSQTITNYTFYRLHQNTYKSFKKFNDKKDYKKEVIEKNAFWKNNYFLEKVIKKINGISTTGKVQVCGKKKKWKEYQFRKNEEGSTCLYIKHDVQNSLEEINWEKIVEFNQNITVYFEYNNENGVFILIKKKDESRKYETQLKFKPFIEKEKFIISLLKLGATFFWKKDKRTLRFNTSNSHTKIKCFPNDIESWDRNQICDWLNLVVRKDSIDFNNINFSGSILTKFDSIVNEKEKRKIIGEVLFFQKYGFFPFYYTIKRKLKRLRGYPKRNPNIPNAKFVDFLESLSSKEKFLYDNFSKLRIGFPYYRKVILPELQSLNNSGATIKVCIKELQSLNLKEKLKKDVSISELFYPVYDSKKEFSNNPEAKYSLFLVFDCFVIDFDEIGLCTIKRLAKNNKNYEPICIYESHKKFSREVLDVISSVCVEFNTKYDFVEMNHEETENYYYVTKTQFVVEVLRKVFGIVYSFYPFNLSLRESILRKGFFETKIHKQETIYKFCCSKDVEDFKKITQNINELKVLELFKRILDKKR